MIFITGEYIDEFKRFNLKWKFHDILYFSDIKRTHNIVVATISVLKNIISNEEWTTAK